MMQPSSVQRILRKLDKTLASLLFIDQWVILTARGMDYESLRWEGLHPLIPAKDRYWGDPFVIHQGDRFYVFIEEKLYATGRGHIACLILDSDGTLLEHQVVLERGYHLSYPFLFHHDGELYMLPETAGNGTIEAYRCTRFPGQWEFSKVLMHDIYAVDATLLAHAGRYWLFANVREPGGSSLNALHLYWAQSPLSELVDSASAQSGGARHRFCAARRRHFCSRRSTDPTRAGLFAPVRRLSQVQPDHLADRR